MKAEDDGKSSYDQVIDELADLLKERKDSKALSFWDKLESRVSTSDRSYNSGKNPDSSSEQVGSSEKRGAVNINSLFKILGNIESTNDTKISTNMLSSTLDQLLSFKHLFTTVENGVNYTFPAGVNTTGNFSVSASSGKGAMKISSVLSEQIDILSSISFDVKNVRVSLGTDKNISIEYSVDLDKYNTVTASILGMPGVSLSTKYTITTTDKYDNSVSTNLALTYNNENKSKPNSELQLETVPNTATDIDLDLRLAGLALLVWAIANNFTGVGFGDDLVAIPSAIAMLLGKT